jgi:hypothetical protein
MKKIIACGDSSGEELVKGYPSFRGEWCVEYSRGDLAYLPICSCMEIGDPQILCLARLFSL